MQPIGTFVDIIAGITKAQIAQVTSTFKRPHGVAAASMRVAVIYSSSAFVDVIAKGQPVPRKPIVACARKRPDGIAAGCICQTTRRAVHAFIDVVAPDTAARVPRNACALKRTNRVRADCVAVTVVHLRRAFVDVTTPTDRSSKSVVADT